jgi:hypothetical protein
MCQKKQNKVVDVSFPQEAKLNSDVMQLGLLTFGRFQVQILVHRLAVLGFLSSARQILGKKLKTVLTTSTINMLNFKFPCYPELYMPMQLNETGTDQS